MKKLISVLLPALFLLQACNKDENRVPTCEKCNFTCLDTDESDVFTNDCLEEWECSFKVTPQSKVDLDEYTGTANGDKNVFQMITETQGDLAIADDESTYILVFELEESQHSFSAEDGDLASLRIYFKHVCFCAEVEFVAPVSGCIQGEKQNDGTWFVQGTLTIPYSFKDIDVKFDAQFAQ